jgi:hypothetical protein
MKPLIAILSLLLTVPALRGEEPKEKFPEFMNFDKKTAAQIARKQAEADAAAGRYRMLVYGLRGKNSAVEDRLAKEGVEFKAIAGCVVNDGILEGARVYNEVMREKLKAKLGRDIFSDKDESQKQPSK